MRFLCDQFAWLTAAKRIKTCHPSALTATSEHSTTLRFFHYHGRWLQIVSRELVKARTQAVLEKW